MQGGYCLNHDSSVPIAIGKRITRMPKKIVIARSQHWVCAYAATWQSQGGMAGYFLNHDS